MRTIEIIVITVFVLIIALSWWLLFRKKERQLTDFLPAWRDILEHEVLFYRDLAQEDRVRFESDVLQFLEDVAITGVQTDVTDLDRLLVASSAVIPIFGFPEWQYRNINEVLLYDGAFNEDYQTAKGDGNILGMVGTGSMQRMMILSKQSLHHGFEQAHSKHNVGIHEFVHLLDKADGATDGIPELFLTQPYMIPWVKVMHQEIKAIEMGESDISVYGSKNEAEFFSVVSEYFFKQPELLQQKHPALYGLLQRVFNTQDLTT